ncbi:MAG: hypothetical protein QM790_13915 [Nibricoccus sp.]
MFKLPLIAVAVAIAAPFTFAEDKDTPPPPPPGEHGGQHKGGPRMDGMKFYTENLDLTQAQQDQLKPIVEARRKELEAIRDDKSLERDAKFAKAGEVFKSYRPKIRALLTPEQQKKFDELKDEMPGRRGPGGPRKEKSKE